MQQCSPDLGLVKVEAVEATHTYGRISIFLLIRTFFAWFQQNSVYGNNMELCSAHVSFVKIGAVKLYLPMSLYHILSLLPPFLDGLRQNSVYETNMQSCLVGVSFVQIGAVEAILTYGAILFFCPYSRDSSTDFDKIWCMCSKCNSVEQCRVFLKSVQQKV